MSLHRTQILLEDWQHERLKELARQRGTTLSDLVRRMVERGLVEEMGPPKRILALAKIVKDGKWTEPDIDRIVYRKDW